VPFTSLACPHCGVALARNHEILRCKRCAAEWPIVAGIPRFCQDGYYWGEIPRDLMMEINELAEERGWREALERKLRASNPEIYRYVLDASRADFSYLLPIIPSSVVLDVGSGWGTITRLLAKRCAHVISVESVSERVEFQRIVAAQEELANVEIIQASFMEMPIAEESIDAAVMNGVLEWVGIANMEEPPGKLQERLLRRIHSLLRPGGRLYIGIENRLGYSYFLGAKDHSGLAFTSLLPRWMANLVMRVSQRSLRRTEQGAGSYRTYTYSYWGYKRLLRETGYKEVEIYIAFPGYNLPAYLVPAENASAFRYLIRRMYSPADKFRRLIRWGSMASSYFGIHRVLAPNFCIYSRKR